jgi:hypothetical protein
MDGSTMRRPREGLALAILAALGGVIGLLAGVYLLFGALANGGWPLVVGVVVLVVSVAELAFAYGTASRSTWAREPGPQAVGFALAIALLLLGFFIVLTIPVRVTEVPIGGPVPSVVALPS